MRITVAIIVLLLFGLVRTPFEIALDRAQRDAHLRQTPLDLSLREQVGQMGFLAALSGFRSPLAAVLWIQAHIAWEDQLWGKMVALLNTVLTLQPRSQAYWDLAAWHMAWNASIASEHDKTVQSPAMRERNSRQYVQLGREILERGIRNNPSSRFLHERLGNLLRDRAQDHCGAAEQYKIAASMPGVSDFVRRFAGYEMAKCPGREREAYDTLLALYNEGEQHHKPTLIITLKELEEKLNIPAEQRISSEIKGRN